MQSFRTVRTLLTAVVTAIVVSSCGGGGLSDVGKQNGVAPKAVVTVLGHPFTANADGSTSATVRAQTEILLTAKDSVEGSAPITNFSYEQTDTNAKIPFVYRTRNTVAFAAPAVTADTSYKFTLTVTDSNGATSKADATFNVKAIRDPDRFLEYLNAPITYYIVVAPDVSAAPNPSADVTGIFGDYKVTVRRLLSYVDRAGIQRNDIALDSAANVAAVTTQALPPPPPPVQIAGSWITRNGATASCDLRTAQAENRVYQLEIPSVDQDDINFITQTGDRTLQLELSDIHEAHLVLEVSVVAGASGGPTPSVCLISSGVNNPTLSPLAPTQRVDVDTLRGPADLTQDTRDSADAYYAALDTTSQRTTFFAWLDANGFNHTAVNYGADAHAVYTNNFDLGFGRDMYMKVNCGSLPIAPGNCDVAAVVVNYGSLEGAAKKLSAINAVAMEYTPVSGVGTPRITKFYAFAPNPRSDTGDFSRIPSVNLDGRGEKYLPGSCTVCHGGTPRGLNINGGYNVDLHTGFLSWDLDALLFPENDPSFSKDPHDAALKDSLSRANQEGELRKLNAGAYLTWDDGTAPGRFALARDLVEHWYTKSATPPANLAAVLSGTHNGAYVPDTWKPGGTFANPSDSDQVYKRVFAQHCRMCHLVQEPNPAVGDVRQAALCDKTVAVAEPAVGTDHQVPMGCYWQFTNAAHLDQRLSEGTMPFARMTSDRLWVLTGSDNQTAGAFLIAHLGRADTLGKSVTVPGTPYATVAVTLPNNPDIGSDVLLQANDQRFVNTVQWAVKRCTVDNDPTSCTVDAPVAGGASSSTVFHVNATGQFVAQLKVNGQSSVIASAPFSVPDLHPVLAAPTPQSFNLGSTLDVSSLISSYGNGQRANAQVSVSTAAPFVVAPAGCAAPSFCAASTDVTLGTTSLVQVSGTFTVSVKDLNDANATPATYNVVAASTLTPPSILLCTSANSATSSISSHCSVGTITNLASSLDLTVVANQAADVRFELTGAPTLANGAGQTGTVHLTNQRSIDYVPPPYISTHSITGTPTTNATDSIGFRLIRVDGNGTTIEQSAAGQIQIQVRARTSFQSDVQNVLATAQAPSGQCLSCHGNVPVANAPSFTQSASALYQLFSTGHLFKLPNRPYVVLPTTPTNTTAQSGLYCWPTDSCPDKSSATPAPTTHNGGTVIDAGMQQILKWIEDGGNSF